jgi:farnesyl diphosphate synthase
MIVKYKTAFYSFYLPVCLAMILHQKRVEPEQFRIIRDVTIPMGEFFQIQDDYLDCYGSPEQIGKVGRDIEEAKCGWLIVNALKVCTPAQRAELEKHYGKEDPAGVARVKQIFNDVGIPRIYAEYEERSYKEVCGVFRFSFLTIHIIVVVEFTDCKANASATNSV